MASLRRRCTRDRRVPDRGLQRSLLSWIERLCHLPPHVPGGVDCRRGRACSGARAGVGLRNGERTSRCVAQALHWFDLPAFFREVRRVAVDGGLLAVWSYGLLRIDPPIDALIEELYSDVVGSFWPPQRASWSQRIGASISRSTKSRCRRSRCTDTIPLRNLAAISGRGRRCGVMRRRATTIRLRRSSRAFARSGGVPRLFETCIGRLRCAPVTSQGRQMPDKRATMLTPAL